MDDLTELYQAVILDHNRRPRNFEKLETANRVATGNNPACGDQFTVYLHLGDGNVIDKITFHGSGCAISKASASVMTTKLKGKTVEEAKELFKEFHKIVTTGTVDEGDFGDISVFAGVHHFPARIKCATLSWHAALNAATGDAETATTE
ncbi:MAG: SUF system NifU family Fe-S cluster assembly protein [Opitutales bacterium]